MRITYSTEVESFASDAARGLAGARYAAIGIPDDEGGFARFVTVGMSGSLVEAIGPLPRTHGLLAALLTDPRPYRTDDVEQDERFGGSWPDHHPRMRSFLGVPIMSGGEIVGALYVTDKVPPGRARRAEFTDADVELIELLAAHAAIALRNASLYERGRELTIAEERNRLARDLHDSVSQTLFSAVYTAEAAATVLQRDVSRAAEYVARVRELTQDALEQLRGLVFELRAPDIATDGLVATLRKHADVLRRVHPVQIEVDGDGDRRLRGAIEPELFRIASEALSNAVRHAAARAIRVEIEVGDDAASVTVRDDGTGFDPSSVAIRARRLGLTSMEERAEALGGRLEIESAPGLGTSVRVEVPVG